MNDPHGMSPIGGAERQPEEERESPLPLTKEMFLFLMKKGLSRKRANRLSIDERLQLQGVKNRLTQQKWNVYLQVAAQERARLKSLPRSQRRQVEQEERNLIEMQRQYLLQQSLYGPEEVEDEEQEEPLTPVTEERTEPVYDVNQEESMQYLQTERAEVVTEGPNKPPSLRRIPTTQELLTEADVEVSEADRSEADRDNWASVEDLKAALPKKGSEVATSDNSLPPRRKPNQSAVPAVSSKLKQAASPTPEAPSSDIIRQRTHFGPSPLKVIDASLPEKARLILEEYADEREFFVKRIKDLETHLDSLGPAGKVPQQDDTTETGGSAVMIEQLRQRHKLEMDQAQKDQIALQQELEQLGAARRRVQMESNREIERLREKIRASGDLTMSRAYDQSAEEKVESLLKEQALAQARAEKLASDLRAERSRNELAQTGPLRDSVIDLEDKVSQLNMQLARSADGYAVLQQTYTQSEDKYQTKIGALESRIRDLEDSLRTSNAKLASVTDKRSRLVVDLDSEREQTRVLKRRVELLEKEGPSTPAKSPLASRSPTSGNEEVEIDTGTLGELKDQIREMNGENSHLQHEINVALAEKQAMYNENEKLRNRISELTGGSITGNDNEQTVQGQLMALRQWKLFAKKELQQVASQIKLISADWELLKETTTRQTSEMQDAYRKFAMDLASVWAEQIRQSSRSLSEAKGAQQTFAARFTEERARRRVLESSLVMPRNRVSVFCKLVKDAENPGSPSFLYGRTDHIVETSRGSPSKQYFFDRVFAEDSSDHSMVTILSDLVPELLHYKNLMIAAFGERGAGQEEQLYDRNGEAGVMRLLAEDLLNSTASMAESDRPAISACAMEVTESGLQDYLAVGAPGEDRPRLEIRRDSAGGIYVTDLTYVRFQTSEDFELLLSTVQESAAELQRRSGTVGPRTVASLLQIVIDSPDTEPHARSSRLSFLILPDSNCFHETTENTQSRNAARMLTAFAHVLTAITTGKSHIPYRDSRLTYLVQESLAPKSTVVLLVNGISSVAHQSETGNVLAYGERIAMAGQMPGQIEPLSAKVQLDGKGGAEIPLVVRTSPSEKKLKPYAATVELSDRQPHKSSSPAWK